LSEHYDKTTENQLWAALLHPKAVAVGEIGLVNALFKFFTTFAKELN